MSTDELPADLDKLIITPKEEQINICDRNPFYSPNTTSGTETNAAAIQNTKKMIHCKMRRIRRRSESNIDDFNNKRIETAVAADNFEIVNPLRCLSGVNKFQLKRSNIAATKRNLLREPVLRFSHDNHQAKCVFSNRVRRMIALNLDEKNRSNVHKPRTNVSIKSSINGTSCFRDLISECNILLDDSKLKRDPLDNTQHLSKNFLICQRRCTGTPIRTISNSECCGEGQQHKFTDSSSRLSCSQEASHNPTNATNCDDVTIVELASYFDTMVHIPKKMSSMAEMMYI